MTTGKNGGVFRKAMTAVLCCLLAATAAAAVSWSGAATVTDSGTYTGTYASTTADQNAVLINGSYAPTFTGITLTKSGSSSGGDDCNFYGINSGLLAKSGATPVITGGTFTTSATGANGVFSYGGGSGDGTKVTISNAAITTSGGNSGGIMTTGGGITKATSLTVTTSGASSAAIRTDRGGGTVTVSKGTYKATGAGSPAIYCTASIDVSDATLTAVDSEAVVIEGKNSVSLTDCVVNGDMEERSGQNYSYQGIFLYQSGSGDADSGTSSFAMSGGSLTLAFKNESGYKRSAFHITNTTAKVSLTSVDIEADDKDYLIQCDGNSAGWGTAGSNGGTCAFTAASQDLSGDIMVDTISALALTLKNGSVWTGKSTIATNSVNTSPTTAPFTLTVASGCKWVVTGDSSVSSLSYDGSVVDASGNLVTIASGDGTVLRQGTSSYTVTVSSASAGSTTTSDDTSSSSEDSSSSGGCNAGFAGLLLLSMLPAAFRGKK